MDHGDSVESSAKSDDVEAAAAGCSPNNELGFVGADGGGDVPNSDMLGRVQCRTKIFLEKSQC